ncbi:MAG: SpoIIIAH-like family protein [Clostridia bacterium]|nr:SpoIIIAH-like family protein [Clostridia bacterium]
MKKIKSKKLGTAVFFILLAACLCGSVYLNWFFGGKTSESAKTLGETKYVGAEAKDPVERYFADARIERQATYDKTVAELNAIIGGEADADNKALAASRLNDMALYDSWQLKIEKLVSAKGFRNCIAPVGERSTSVIVAASELTAAEVASIKDVVMRTTGQKASEIQITTYKAPSD